jgi:hypothetical protein
MASASMLPFAGKRQLRCLSQSAPEPGAQLDRAERAADQHVGADIPSHRELGGSACLARAAIATIEQSRLSPAIPLKLRLNSSGVHPPPFRIKVAGVYAGLTRWPYPCL